MKAKPRTPDALKVHSHKKQYRLGWRSHISQTISIYAGRLGWKSSSKWATERTYIGFVKSKLAVGKSLQTQTPPYDSPGVACSSPQQASLFVGCENCGSPVDSRTWEKTWRCILVQDIGALCLEVNSSSYSWAPKLGGYNERERDLVGDRSVLS